MGLRWVAALVGIAAEEHQVNIFAQGILHDFIEGGQEIVETPREAGLGVYARAVVLNPEMQVGEVKYSHLKRKKVYTD